MIELKRGMSSRPSLYVDRCFQTMLDFKSFTLYRFFIHHFFLTNFVSKQQSNIDWSIFITYSAASIILNSSFFITISNARAWRRNTLYSQWLHTVHWCHHGIMQPSLTSNNIKTNAIIKYSIDSHIKHLKYQYALSEWGKFERKSLTRIRSGYAPIMFEGGK